MWTDVKNDFAKLKKNFAGEREHEAGAEEGRRAQSEVPLQKGTVGLR